MNKQKYIHIKRKVSRNNYTGNSGKKPKHRPMCIEDYEKLPSKEPLKSKSYRYHDYYYSTTYLDFDSVIGKYLKEKIGVCFDDIYTDLISKTKPKHRYLLDDTLDWFLTKVVYYEKEVPYSTKYWRHGDNVIFGHFYLDRDRKVRYFETKNELIIYARNKYRQKKLKRILDECDE